MPTSARRAGHVPPQSRLLWASAPTWFLPSWMICCRSGHWLFARGMGWTSPVFSANLHHLQLP